jgi:hypothetical protein
VKKLLTILFLLITIPAFATTYYVRTDGGQGGTTSTKCNGQYDVAYTTGKGPNCAFNHPNWPLPLNGQPTTYKMSGGDTLVIEAGSYRIGCSGSADCTDATINITDTGSCYKDWSGDCKGGVIPSGSSGTHTKIIGCSVSGCGVNTKPELWGAGRSQYMMSVNGSSYVDIQDLEITDHEACDRGGSTPPNGCAQGISTLNADIGIYANSGDHITMTNLNIHGLGEYGMLLGGVNTLTMTNVKINRNGYGGWSGDSCSGAGTCGMSGIVTLDNVEITYNGCIESYPGTSIVASSCWSQTSGGYGDGVGMGYTSGNWIVKNSNISHNVQDGFDLLYGSGSPRANVSIDKSLFEGNTGNQIKFRGNSIAVTNSVVIGNCGFFDSTGYEYASFDSCRAGGDTIAIDGDGIAGATWRFYNNFIGGEGNDLFLIVDNESTCNGSETLDLKNNIFYGLTAYWGGGPATVFSDIECSLASSLNDYNIAYGSRNQVCTDSNQCVDPKITSAITRAGTDQLSRVYIQASSHARDAADETVTMWNTSDDYNSFSRGASWDIGALEYGSVPSEGGADCAGTTTDNCDLTTTSDGGTSGTCSSGYSGSCSFSCSNGTWSSVSNTCAEESEGISGFLSGGSLQGGSIQ